MFCSSTFNRAQRLRGHPFQGKFTSVLIEGVRGTGRWPAARICTRCASGDRDWAERSHDGPGGGQRRPGSNHDGGARLLLRRSRRWPVHAQPLAGKYRQGADGFVNPSGLSKEIEVERADNHARMAGTMAAQTREVLAVDAEHRASVSGGRVDTTGKVAVAGVSEVVVTAPACLLQETEMRSTSIFRLF